MLFRSGGDNNQGGFEMNIETFSLLIFYSLQATVTAALEGLSATVPQVAPIMTASGATSVGLISSMKASIAQNIFTTGGGVDNRKRYD